MAAEATEGFKEYPTLQGHVQGPDKEWYNLRAWADREGNLKGKLEIHGADGGREKLDLSFKENARGFGATVTTAEGDKRYIGLTGQKVEKNEKEYTHAVMGVSAMEKGEDGKTKFVPLSERPGRVRMNEEMARLEKPREAQILGDKLGVSRRDLEPYRGEPSRAEPSRAEPSRSEPAQAAPAQEPKALEPYTIKQEKTIGDRDAGADHGVWSGKVMGVDREKRTIDMESKIGGENGVTRVHLQGPVPANVEVGQVQKIGFDRESQGYTAGPVERKAPGKDLGR